MWLAQQNVVELHPGLFRVDRPDRVDVLVFDLDPGGPEPPVHQAAHWVREVLVDLGLDPRVKTSGKKGLHLLVPIERRYAPDRVRALALAIARMAADRHPDALTVQMRKAEREGRLLVDWSRTGIARDADRGVEPAGLAAGHGGDPADLGRGRSFAGPHDVHAGHGPGPARPMGRPGRTRAPGEGRPARRGRGLRAGRRQPPGPHPG